MMFCEDSFPLSSNRPTSELYPASISSPQLHDENNLDDIWGSASSSSTSEVFPGEANHIRNEPSDIPRLRSEHSTAGYRDGLSSAKNTTIQEGFDEGYSLGAVMGVEVGIVLGLLEGIHLSMRTADVENASEKKRINAFLEEARRELRTEEVFGKEWWGTDGVWKFEIMGESVDGAGEFTFKDVVISHPVIRKWKKLVNDEVKRYGLDMTIMERAEEGRNDSDNEG